jgi:thiol-disulfide isomerase/thioredoxin
MIPERPAGDPAFTRAGPPGLLARVGAALVAPRALLARLPEGSGSHDGAALLAAYALAVALPVTGDALADFLALRSLGAAPGLLRGLLPLLPWLLTAAAVEWRLGPTRAHRAALCMVPLLLVDGLAHLLRRQGVPLPGPAEATAALGGLVALAVATAARGTIPPAAAPGPPAAAAEPSGTSPRPPDASSGISSTAPPDELVMGLSPGTSPADLTPGTSPSDLSPGTSPADLTPGTSPADLSPGTSPADLSPGTSSASPALPSPGRARAFGLVVAGLVAVSAANDLTWLVRSWPRLAPLAAGDALPAFRVPLLAGGALTPDDLRGGPHLLVFWASWCGVCRSEMPALRALAARYRDLRLVLVNADHDGDRRQISADWLAEYDLAVPVALDDGGMRRSFRVEVLPHLVLVGRDGRVAHTWQGRAFERDLAAAVERALPPT